MSIMFVDLNIMFVDLNIASMFGTRTMVESCVKLFLTPFSISLTPKRQIDILQSLIYSSIGMRSSHQLSRRDNDISLSFDEYRRLKTIEESYLKGYSVVPLFFPSEDLNDYAHGQRVRKSLKKALTQYPPLAWK